MGFTSMTMSNKTTMGFIFYGQWMMVEFDSGDLFQLLYQRELAGRRGIFLAVECV